MIAALLLAACGSPGLPDLSDGPHAVQAELTWRVELDAHYPTDLLPMADGGLWVLDGYEHRLLRFDDRREELDPVQLPVWVGGSRLAAAVAGGAWLADPKGHIVRLDADGVIDETLPDPLAGTGRQPVALLEHGGGLWVSDRDGSLRELDPATLEQRQVVAVDADGQPLGLVTDLLPHPEGGLLAVDSLRTAVHHIDDGVVQDSWGRFGMWAGALMKPKAAVAGPAGTVLIADSALDVLQLFEADGGEVGMLVDADQQPLRFVHAVAVEALGAEELVVLDAGEPALLGVRMSAAAVSVAREEARATHALRYGLRELDGAGVAGLQGDTCLQCHDGLVLDDREVWQRSLFSHPVDIVPDTEVPAFFPLDEQGQLRCTTCHSPHGAAEAAQAGAVGDEDQRLALVRHTEQEEFFTRLARGDSALCEACHTDAAHDDALGRLALVGSAHPVGSALEDALAARFGDDVLPEQIEKGCLGCHAPHGALDDKLLRSAGDGKGCLSCHESQADASRSHPVGAAGARARPRQAADIPLDRDGRVDCGSCHRLVGGMGDALLRVPADGDDLCTSCHDDRVTTLSGPHGRVRGAAGMACLGCHDVHDQAGDHLLIAKPGGAEDPTGCLSCHAEGKRHTARGLAPGRRGHVVDGDTHEGMDGALTCASCHDAHRPRAGACDDCHTDQAQERDRGGHGTAECLDCHPAHDDAPLARDPQHNPQSWPCLTCHGEQSGRGSAARVVEFQHPTPVFEPDGTRWKPLGDLPLFGPDGAAQGAGLNGDMACTTCHRVHGPDPVSPKSKLKRPGWEKPCAACHGDNALPLYRYFHQPDRRAGIDTKDR